MHKRVILFTLRAFVRSFANTKGAIVRPRTHLLNFSFAFIVSFFFSASMDDDSLMCMRRMCVNRFIVITHALDEFPFFGLKHFPYLGPTLHACARPITGCNITFGSAHHARSFTALTITHRTHVHSISETLSSRRLNYKRRKCLRYFAKGKSINSPFTHSKCIKTMQIYKKKMT